MSVQAYTIVFDDLTLRCELQEGRHQIISRFRSGLRTDILGHDHSFSNYKDPCTSQSASLGYRVIT